MKTKFETELIKTEGKFELRKNKKYMIRLAPEGCVLKDTITGEIYEKEMIIYYDNYKEIEINEGEKIEFPDVDMSHIIEIPKEKL